MVKRYALIDTANTFFRARHVASRNSDPEEKVAMAIHLTMASVNMVARRFGIDHVAFMLEGRSFRKDLYQPYKAHRRVAEQAQTEAEKIESELFWQTYDEFISYLRDRTNCSVLRNPQAEADDLIARWIHLHPDAEHFIISSDSDYIQLIAPNVKQFNGISGELITVDGYFNEKGVQVKDKKTKEPKLLEDPEYLLFKKCVRGDTSDNIFSAAPGAREKGTKNKVGIREAFEDREKKGYNFNNFMLQRWSDHNNVEHRVLDDYNRNRMLIDLTAQPDDIKASVDATICEGVRTEKVSNVGIHLLKWCGKHELQKISENAEIYSKWLGAPYEGELHGKDPS